MAWIGLATAVLLLFSVLGLVLVTANLLAVARKDGEIADMLEREYARRDRYRKELVAEENKRD